jgi:hypothetical protein
MSGNFKILITTHKNGWSILKKIIKKYKSSKGISI